MANEKNLRTLEFGIVPGGFAIAASVWLTAYVCRIPTIAVGSHLVLGLLIGVMVVGAVLVGFWGRPIRLGHGGDGGEESFGTVVRRTTLTMLVAGFVNVFLVGSVVGAATVAAEGDGVVANEVTLSALWWVPGSLVATALIGVLAGVFVGMIRPEKSEAPCVHQEVDWFCRERTGPQAALGFVIVFTTLCLILVGGVVTSAEAGLSVPDWPNSYGWNMFLFPYSKMVGGIYYEHAHRLIGSLVGLETLVLFVWLWRHPPRRMTGGRRIEECGERGRAVSNRRYSWAGTVAFVLVCVQGFLGGARVFLVNEFGDSATEKIAVVHAAHAQVFLLVVGMLAWSLRWRSADDAASSELRTDGGLGVLRWISVGLLVLVLAQTLAGAMYRHMGGAGILGIHMAGAAFVFVLMMVEMGIAITGSLGNDPRSMRVLRSIFVTFVIVALQVALGFGSWWVTSRYDRMDQVSSEGMVFLTAGHVVCGSVLLVFAGWSALWVRNFGRLEAIKAD